MVGQDRLFLGRGDIILGAVTSAEIACSKEGGRKYIRCKVDIGPTDREASCFLSKMIYTAMAIREDWDTSEEAETKNAQKLAGRIFEVKVDHIMSLDGKQYVGLKPVREYW